MSNTCAAVAGTTCAADVHHARHATLRADVHIIEPAGSEIWIDVRIHTAHADQSIGRELLREEHQKCRGYGQHGYDINRLEQGMIPVVLEQHGRTAPGAQALFQRLLHHRTQALVRQGLAAYSSAKHQASSELWAPLSCNLLRAAWQSLAECQPTPMVARPPNSSTPARLDVDDTHLEARQPHQHAILRGHPRGQALFGQAALL